MRNKIVLCLVLAIGMLVVGVGYVAAQGPPDSVYVDNSYAGNEDGSQSSPYNTQEEGEAYLQSLPDGGDLYVKNESGEWVWDSYVAASIPGGAGDLLPATTLYLLLALTAIVSLSAGWYFIRRAHKRS